MAQTFVGKPPSVTGWLLMTVAMMGPAALPGVKPDSAQQPPKAARQGGAGVAGGYLAVWTVDGVVVLTLLTVIPWAHSRAVFAVVLAGAAMWQLTPLKRTALRECHRSVPLAPEACERTGRHPASGRATASPAWARAGA